uniref:Serine/threonine protein phosphatase 7 long form isogeny n=1 Tax=Cajanus cajan TaxID=3821 RepID=A0A151RSA3_CAJCA|nr:Serine/threonine protein phosphatase 7 long form isogeny [Cajanus cajan]
MPDKSGNRLHLMYLPLLTDLECAGRYSCGSTYLTYLYREMCRAIYSSSKKMGGCSLLLQSWAWYRMPFIQPRVERDITYSLALRWTGRGLRFTGMPHGDLLGYRLRYDNMNHNEFLWMPYRGFESSLPTRAYKDSRIWISCTVVASFAVIVWHQSDRVQLQYGLWQSIPNEVHNLDKMHEIDMRGHSDTNWAEQHAY